MFRIEKIYSSFREGYLYIKTLLDGIRTYFLLGICGKLQDSKIDLKRSHINRSHGRQVCS
jgi:hypothetical protein